MVPQGLAISLGLRSVLFQLLVTFISELVTKGKQESAYESDTLLPDSNIFYLIRLCLTFQLFVIFALNVSSHIAPIRVEVAYFIIIYLSLT